jgi:hypothetical protein
MIDLPVIASEAKPSIKPRRKYGLLRGARNDGEESVTDPAAEYP